jgi:hypothetical protein
VKHITAPSYSPGLQYNKKGPGLSLPVATTSADLGGSSKYSSEGLEGRHIMMVELLLVKTRAPNYVLEAHPPLYLPYKCWLSIKRMD